MKKYEWPESWDSWIRKNLSNIGYNLDEPKILAEAILKVSDNYQSPQSVTDWSSKEVQAAYLSYYFTLNYMRSLKVLDEIKSLDFLDGIETLIDFGCGPGPSTKAIAQDEQLTHIQQAYGIDNHEEVRGLFLETPRKNLELFFSRTKANTSLEKTAIVASYAINELSSIPPWFYQAEALVILEPSTKQASHGFQDLRSELIDRQYNIWAPCPHHETCPLTESKKDWCHDRLYWNAPDWFKAIEEELPIKNESLTFSYLLARKKSKPIDDSYRIVGDALAEKGKTRWMICRNSEREFISFLKRHGEAPRLYRGDKIKLKNFEKKSNELRFTNEDLD